MDNSLVNNFKTPQEFIDYYYQKIKEDLNTYNIQLNKVGVIGFFINLLGNTNFDVKQYFDSLFTEAFVATARQDRNLLLHSAIYGVDVNFATSATASGTINFNFRNLPTKTSDVVRREVILGDLENGIEFQIDDYKFKSISQYIFIEESLEDGSTQYYCNIKTPHSSENIPSTTYDITADLIETYQYYTAEYTTILSNYTYLTYENYSITIPDGEQVNDLEVYVKTRDSDTYEQYEVKTSKHFESKNDKTVFYRIVNSNNIQIEFGNGIRGKYVPEAEVRIIAKLTRGNEGNLPRTTNCTLSSDLHATVIYYRADNTTYAPQTYEVSNLFNITLESSVGGLDMPTGDDLRNNILKYVRSRDNFISEEDFYDIASKYSNNFKFLFRKVGLAENVFYLLQSFRDKYKNIVKTTNLTIEKFDPTGINITNVNSSIDYTVGNLDKGSYRYAIIGTDGFSFTEPYEMSVNIEVDFATVTLTWDNIEKCNRYLIYRKSPTEDDYSRYYYTYDTTFSDDGYRTDDTEVLGMSNLGNIMFPSFMISGTEVISPFMYIYDKNMHWWDGYLVYPFSIVYFNKIDIPDDSIYDVPITYFNIIYSYADQSTKIQIKSYQDISEYKFYLTIEKLNLYEIEMTSVDQNTFEYVNIKDYGVLVDPTVMIVKCLTSKSNYVFTGTTDYVYQCHNISDTLRLFEYSIAGNKQIINIPVIDKEVFESDATYYLDSVYNFIKGFEFSENRMISDNVQTRFLNSISLDKLYVKNMTVQGHDFDIVFPLKMKIDLILNKEYITLNGISVSEELDNILLEVTSELNNNYTGINISFYNSKIVDLIHDNNGRDAWVKSVKVTIFDSAGTQIDGGLENNTDDYDMFLKIAPMKLELIKYTPPFWYWDVDNIETTIKYY